MKYFNIVSVNKNDEDTEDDQVDDGEDDGEDENKKKSQFLFYKDFNLFLKVLRDYYFLCMVKKFYEAIFKFCFIHRLLKILIWRWNLR